MRTSVLIVDDHAAFRASATAMLEADGFDVVGEAADGPSAVEAVARHRPDVVLVDIQLTGSDGIALASQLAELDDPPAIVLISSREASTYGSRLTGAPALAFIPKHRLTGRALAAVLR